MANEQKGISREQVGNKQGTSQMEGKERSKMENVDERVKKVVRALGKEMMTRRGIMGTMELKGRRSFLQYHLTPAMVQGYVCFVYPQSPNSPDQQYRLTEKGLTLLAEINAEREQVGNKLNIQ